MSRKPVTDLSPGLLKACAKSGERYRVHAVQAAAQSYVRQRHLARIVPVTPEAIADTSYSGTQAIVEKLERVSRNLGHAARERHWSYDANRHIAVLGALRAERAHLAALSDTKKRCRASLMKGPAQLSSQYSSSLDASQRSS